MVISRDQDGWVRAYVVDTHTGALASGNLTEVQGSPFLAGMSRRRWKQVTLRCKLAHAE